MDRYNTFWPRFCAMLVDGFILYFINLGLNLVAPTDSRVLSIIYNFVVSNVPYAYAIWMIGEYGQTLGKRFMEIKVVDNRTEGKIGYRQSALREAVPLVLINLSLITAVIVYFDVNPSDVYLTTFGWIILFVPHSMLATWAILEIVTMAIDEKRRALHDKIADTVVVRVS